MKKLKVVTVVGTRPEIIRLSRVMTKLDEHCNQVIVHTGQNYDYELNEIFFQDLEVRKPDHFLNAAGKNATETIAQVIMKVDQVLENESPDALLILGDTNSCLASIAAKRRQIPIFHMEAGNRCFDQRVPEEINRKIVDHTADINLTYSTIARDYLLREGLPPDRIIKTGSPMYEVLRFYDEKIKSSQILQNLALRERKYFVVSAHREENIETEENFSNLVRTLNKIAATYKLPVIVSTHPRTRKRIDSAKVIFHEGIRLIKPFCFTDYVHLQINSRAVLSDSGTITEEASILNFPALNIRETHERPEGFEEGAVMMVGLEAERILQSISILDSQPRGSDRLLKAVHDYTVPNVSEKVVRIIHSYVDYVNKRVWHK